MMSGLRPWLGKLSLSPGLGVQLSPQGTVFERHSLGTSDLMCAAVGPQEAVLSLYLVIISVDQKACGITFRGAGCG